MTNPNLTLLGVVLDRSGSMAATRSATVSGFNELMDAQRKGPGEAVVYLSLFNHVTEVVHRVAPIGIVPRLTFNEYVPHGNTALLDAIGRTIADIGHHLAHTPEHDRPGKVIIAIMTDGEENCSTLYGREQIKSMIEHQRTTYAWDFLFMGANQDAILTGAELGMQRGHTITYMASTRGSKNTMSATNSVVSSLRAGNAAAYSATDRDEAMVP